jgi:hypothetical protein
LLFAEAGGSGDIPEKSCLTEDHAGGDAKGIQLAFFIDHFRFGKGDPVARLDDPAFPPQRSCRRGLLSLRACDDYNG